MRAQLSQILKIQKTRQITTGFFFLLQLVTLETTLRMYWRDPRLRVDHLLNNSSLDGDEYVLLHPETSRFIWFPDIYIGKSTFVFLIYPNNLLYF